MSGGIEHNGIEGNPNSEENLPQPGNSQNMLFGEFQKNAGGVINSTLNNLEANESPEKKAEKSVALLKPALDSLVSNQKNPNGALNWQEYISAVDKVRAILSLPPISDALPHHQFKITLLMQDSKNTGAAMEKILVAELIDRQKHGGESLAELYERLKITPVVNFAVGGFDATKELTLAVSDLSTMAALLCSIAFR